MIATSPPRRLLMRTAGLRSTIVGCGCASLPLPLPSPIVAFSELVSAWVEGRCHHRIIVGHGRRRSSMPKATVASL
uniref:Uncharacterized protein n=1 Tax=Arundo donax TaxID=35708 RepID=A0A0A8YIV3_ARUDO